MKVFLLVSAGSKPEPYLNIVHNCDIFGITEEYAKLYLKGLAWISEEDYLPFFEKAEVGEVIMLKEIYLLFRLKDYEES